MTSDSAPLSFMQAELDTMAMFANRMRYDTVERVVPSAVVSLVYKSSALCCAGSWDALCYPMPVYQKLAVGDNVACALIDVTGTGVYHWYCVKLGDGG